MNYYGKVYVSKYFILRTIQLLNKLLWCEMLEKNFYGLNLSLIIESIKFYYPYIFSYIPTDI